MTTKIVARVDHVDAEHVHVSLFVGPSDGTIALSGRLVLRTGEYQVWSAALTLGAKEMGFDHLIVEHDDTKFVEWATRHP
jgi:hypothetical protein